MKIRTDYVTNSSSSSFIIAKRNLDTDQIKAVREHWTLAKKMGMIDEGWDYPWQIEENDSYITGYVSMDNFQISDLFDKIGIDDSIVYWDDYRFDLNDKNDIKEAEKSFKSKEKREEWRDMLYED